MCRRFLPDRRCFIHLVVVVSLASMPVFAGAKQESRTTTDSSKPSQEGPRFNTVEDVQGESKNRFQAAIGMLSFEKVDDTVPDPVASYGLGVDDLLFEWSELSLVADGTDCLDMTTGGQCASLDTSVGTAFSGRTSLEVIVLDTSRGSGSDCNYDNDNTDVGRCNMGAQEICTDVADCATAGASCVADSNFADDTDCDNDGTADVPITAKSENEQPGERIVLPCANPSGPACPDGEYSGGLPVSAVYDSDGVVFVQRQGGQNPVIQINYFDWDDGTGNQCANSIDPLFNGLIQAFTTVRMTSASVGVTQLLITDNGDNDTWADTNETVDMRIAVRNNTSVNLHNVVARLATNDPNVDCINNTSIPIGLVLADDPATVGVDEAVKTPTGAFTFRIADVQRTGHCSIATTLVCDEDSDCPATETCDAVLQDFDASFSIFLNADEFDSAQLALSANIDLDIDGVGGGIPIEFIEDFETGVNGGFGQFGINNMDSFNASTGNPNEIAGMGGHGGSLVNSDGYRCSFNDPDDPNAFTFEDPDCFLGMDTVHADSVWWHTTTDRAFDGTRSMAYNTPAGGVIGWTTPTGVMEALQLLDPVALGYKNVCINDPSIQCTVSADCGGNECINSFPRVVWKHQISLMDYRSLGVSSAIRSADGGVIQLQLADPAANPVGNWIKVDTTVNRYDAQREDNYNVCSFDPVDDGNDEDTGFGGPSGPVITDPNDPDYDPRAYRDYAGRKISSSSTCFPEFVYTYMGDTDSAYDPNNIGNATVGPGLEGSDTNGPNGSGLGTWIESVVDLSRFRGQNVRVRMLISAIKINTTWQAAFNYTISRPGDDGWWIDDVRIKDAIDSPATLVADVKANANGCAVGGAACVSDADCGANGPCLFPLCGAACNSITPSLVADPTGTLAAPGQVVELSASDSMADRCANGVLQFRFWLDGDSSGGAYDGGINDTLLRNWSENPALLAAPVSTNDYAVDVRCSSATGCTDTGFSTVAVNCPQGSTTLMADAVTKGTFNWTGPIDYGFAEGDLDTLSAAYSTLTTGSGTGSTYTVGGVVGTSRWLLIRKINPPGPECNAGLGSWGDAGRDSNLP